MIEKQKNKTLFKNAIICIGDEFEFIRGHLIEEDGLIYDVIHADDFDGSLKIYEEIDCSKYVITPGFVNCHIHLNQLLNRTMLDGKGRDDLIETMHGRHTKKTHDDRFWASLLSIEEALESGTTYLWGFGSGKSRIVEAMKVAGIRGSFTMAKKDAWFGNKHDVDISKTDQIINELRYIVQSWDYPLITPVLGVASERAASEQLLMQIGQLANELSLKFNMHIAEGQSPVDDLVKHIGLTSVDYLSQFDFFNSDLSLIHATSITEQEMELLANKNISVCHCPISNARTGVGLFNIKLAESLGINICLGTDAASTGNTNNILLEGYSAILLHNSHNHESNALSEKDVFRMMTVNGAKAAGLETKIGQLKKGYFADFVMWPIGQPLCQPFYKDRILNLIVFSGGQIKPQYVYVNGKLVFDKKATNFDLETAIEMVNMYANKG